MLKQKIKWTLAKNADPAMSAPEIILLLPGTVIKENPVRAVIRITDPDTGMVYYVKRDTPRSFLKKVGRFFCSKSKQEFLASLYLRKNHIPVIRYEALGESFSASYLISKEIKGYCSAAQFWYSNPPDNLRQRFISALTALLLTLNQKKILHPDFHLGNLMCDPLYPESLLLPDPYGIRKVWFRNVTKYNSIIITNLAAELSADAGRSLLQATGADPALWDILLQKNADMVQAQWERRKKQILTGNSKFSRTEILDGITYHIRNTRWFAHTEFAPQQYTKVVMPHEQAAAIWLDSFRKEMLYDVKGHPKAWSFSDKETALYYDYQI
ncbi:MAG: hypothetical protein IKB16_01380 [Lentisphaeria bacterium]|nr:hypothetical protein [Lentisphaeria bacterium]